MKTAKMTEKHCIHVGNQPYIHGFCPWCEVDTEELAPVVRVPSNSRQGLPGSELITVPPKYACSVDTERAYCLGRLESSRPDVLQENRELGIACDRYLVAWNIIGKDEALLHKNNKFHKCLRAYLEGLGELGGKR